MMRTARIAGVGALLSGAVMLGAVALASAQGAPPSPSAACPYMGSDSWARCGQMVGGWGDGQRGMMGGGGYGSGPGMMGTPERAPAPGSPGFVAGTVDSPRVVRIVAGPGYRFSPASVPIVADETITFEVTVMGPTTHEFKVGPLDEVIADAPGLPEISGLGMMQAGSLTYSFTGSGPFGFACHEPGHFEAGMFGLVTPVG